MFMIIYEFTWVLHCFYMWMMFNVYMILIWCLHDGLHDVYLVFIYMMSTGFHMLVPWRSHDAYMIYMMFIWSVYTPYLIWAKFILFYMMFYVTIYIDMFMDTCCLYNTYTNFWSCNEVSGGLSAASDTCSDYVFMSCPLFIVQRPSLIGYLFTS